MEKREIDRKVEKAFSSLDGIKTASPSPWFLARVRGRLSVLEPQDSWSRASSFVARPIFIVATLFFVLLFNMYMLFNATQKESVVADRVETVADNNYDMATSYSASKNDFYYLSNE